MQPGWETGPGIMELQDQHGQNEKTTENGNKVWKSQNMDTFFAIVKDKQKSCQYTLYVGVDYLDMNG